MFAENFKSTELELSRIKNMSEFGMNLDECKILFSKDLKYGVIYTETFVSIVDMNNKKFISKFSCEENARISKLKVTFRNNITYLKKTSEYINLVISSINFIGSFFEVRVPYDIVDYAYVEANINDDNQDYIFLLTSKGDLEFYYLRHQIEKKKVNLVKDSGNKLKLGYDVNYMEYIEETRNLIIVMSNGTVLNYTVSDDPESENHLGMKKTICFEEILHLDFFDFTRDQKLISKTLKNYEVTAFRVTKFVFNLEEFIVKDKLFEESELEIKNNNQPQQSVFLVVGFTKNKYDTYLSFYEVQSHQLVFLNRIELKGKVLLDSCIYQTKNRELNGTVPDYFIICCKLIGSNKIQILASDFIECLKQNENKRLRDGMMDIDREGEMQQDQTEKNIFTLVNEFDDPNNSTRNLGIVGVCIVENSDYSLKSKFEKLQKKDREEDGKSVSVISNINDYKYMEYSIELILRKLMNFSAFDVYIVDSGIQQLSFTPSKKFMDKLIFDKEKIIEQTYEELLKNALTGDVNKHIDFFDKNISNDLVLSFRSKVISLISEAESYQNFPLITQLRNTDNKVDFYLLLLLFHDDEFAIKYYLSLHENLTKRQFLVSNHKLFHTSNNIFFAFLRELIYENLRAPVINFEFFLSDKLFSNLMTIKHLMQISKQRCDYPYDLPYDYESEIIEEDLVMIQNIMFEVENFILIVKIIRSFYNNIFKKENEENLNRITHLISESVKNKKEQRKERSKMTKDTTYFELILMNNQSDVYPHWKKYFFNFVNQMRERGNQPIISSDKNAENQIKYEELLKFSKFQFFFYYVYLVLDYEKLWREIKNEGIGSFAFEYNLFDERKMRTYFDEMKEEFSSYFNIALNFYKLDMNLGITPSNDKKMNQSNFLPSNPVRIDSTIISNFLISINKSNIAKTHFFKENMNILKININSALVNLLFNDKYFNEALILCKNIINLVTDYEDMMTQLSLLLDMGLVNLAYQYVNNCFASLVWYSEEMDYESSYERADILEKIAFSTEYQQVKRLYFYFFNSMIRSNHISLLFSLPYNFIERSILKEFLIGGKQEFEELLLLYFINLKKVKEAEALFSDFQKSSYQSNESKKLFFNIIETLKILYGEMSQEKLEQISRRIDSAELNVEVNINKEKDKMEDLKKIPGGEIKNINEIATNILYDSFMDIENIPYKPSNISLNDTIKSLLSRKQETAKKTFGCLTDIKPVRNRDLDFVSERVDRNFLDNSKFKSFIGFSKSPINKNNFTPLKRERDNVNPLNFSSNIFLKNASGEKDKSLLD